MTNRHKQKGSAHAAIVVVLVLVIITALGYAFWSNFSKADDKQPLAEAELQPNEVCKNDEDKVETGGVFCSEAIGIKFNVPETFQGKIEKAENYEVYEGGVDFKTRVSAGDANVVYSAATSGLPSFTFTVAKEPLRSGYVDVGHGLAGAYYDKDSKILSSVIAPSKIYNATTGAYTEFGTYSLGPPVPSFDVEELKIYKGTVEDAGSRTETYFAVINGSIVKIKLTHIADIGPKGPVKLTNAESRVFKQLETAVKGIEIVAES